MFLYFFSDCFFALFLFLTLNLFLNSFYTCQSASKQFPYKILFIILWEALALSPFDSYSSVIMLLFDFFYTALIVRSNLRTKLLAFIKYETYYFLGSTIIALLHLLLTMDIYIYGTNEIYAKYTNVIDYFLLYVILSMYIILKQLSAFPSGRVYKRYFMTITTIAVALLVVCSMLLGSTIIKQEDMVPLMLTLLLIITFLCISIYRKVIAVLEENARTKMEAEKYALQLDYQEHIEENLKALSTLRHDFKNHLIIIGEYARRGDHEKLQSYIESIQQELAPTKLIDTPSNVISSLMNAKNETCKRKNITLNFKADFDKVNLDDFFIVTILSNLMDNAITATAKCEGGYINLTISKLNSYLEIDCVNNHQEKIIEKNGIFKTTKTEHQEIHGIGITSIRKTAEKVRGTVKIDYTEDTFHINILIPNY